MINFLVENWIEIVGAIFGLLYIFYEYKASMKMWPIGILMSLFYIYVFVQHKFYAFALINVYYIIVGIYGWMKWKQNSNQDNDVQIKNIPRKHIITVAVAIFLIFIPLTYILKTFTDSNVIYADAIITTLSIVAMVMLAQRWAEQWLLLIVLNFISTAVYFTQDLYATSIMYFVYSFGSILGYLNWRKLALTHSKKNESL